MLCVELRELLVALLVDGAAEVVGAVFPMTLFATGTMFTSPP
jgi:hypothetical protein